MSPESRRPIRIEIRGELPSDNEIILTTPTVITVGNPYGGRTGFPPVVILLLKVLFMDNYMSIKKVVNRRIFDGHVIVRLVDFQL